ncbi:hypothetical protein hamaS1_22980 [Moorella sp. Hama-1]|nr:hypothetical protein hamaS1_22980 [Moorella sp. Hama-1]
MVNIIQAEYLKFRRTFTRRLAVLAPTFFILFALPQVAADNILHAAPEEFLTTFLALFPVRYR